MSSTFPTPDPDDPRYSKEARKAYKENCHVCHDTGIDDRLEVRRCWNDCALNPDSPYWIFVHKWL